MKIYNNLLETVGNTPLVKISKFDKSYFIVSVVRQLISFDEQEHQFDYEY